MTVVKDALGLLKRFQFAVLIDRRDRQFRLTMAGQRFLKHAGRLLELQREIKSEMGGEAQVEVQMRIGAIESVLHSWLIPWVEQLRGEYPALELELSVETTPVLIELVRRGALDIVFTASTANAYGSRLSPVSGSTTIYGSRPTTGITTTCTTPCLRGRTAIHTAMSPCATVTHMCRTRTTSTPIESQ